jgi:hypothetical protein
MLATLWIAILLFSRAGFFTWSAFYSGVLFDGYPEFLMFAAQATVPLNFEKHSKTYVLPIIFCQNATFTILKVSIFFLQQRPHFC